MTFALTWLPEVLEAAGLKVAEAPGWRTRGVKGLDMGKIRGVICHHTGTAAKAKGNIPTYDILIRGRSDLSGPLCHLGLGRDGTFYVIAAGRAQHAGAGTWESVTTGNMCFVGIEAEHSGTEEEPWPAVQMEAYQRGVAAILQKIGAGANMCCGHKEWAPSRKVDPNFDMAAFRRAVAGFMEGKTPNPPIPATDAQARPTMRRGDRGDLVVQLQTKLIKLKLLAEPKAGPNFGPKTEAAVREFQRRNGIVGDGIVGPKTWAKLDAA
jgi:hypothetical protein